MGDVPVHLVLASDSIDEVEQEDFLLDNLTLDFSRDVTGVSWCGILKNIYAIGAGIRSHDADWDRAHYTTRVVDEMTRLLYVLGGV
jgi:glycerol-3-phosphate dehydrogenase